MLKSHESPKNGDYVSYIDELLKQSSLSSPAQNPGNDFTQDLPESFSSHEDFSSAVPAKSTSYSLPQPPKTNTNKPATYTASTFNKNVRRFFFLIFLLVFLGSIIAESDGQGAIVLIIIVVIAIIRFMATIFNSTKSNRKK